MELLVNDDWEPPPLATRPRPHDVVGKHATFNPGGENMADDPYKGRRVKVISRVNDCAGEAYCVQTEGGVEFYVLPFELEDWS